jgi:hypothetical protein
MSLTNFYFGIQLIEKKIYVHIYQLLSQLLKNSHGCGSSGEVPYTVTKTIGNRSDRLKIKLSTTYISASYNCILC